MTDFNGANNTGLFNFKEKVTDQINADGAKNVEIAAPLNYWSSFSRALSVLLINCEMIVIMTWSAICVTVSTNIANQQQYSQ